MRLHNTLGRRLAELAPLEAGHVRLYTCGPTVYNVVHIGNLRTFVFEDVLRRHLLAKGYRVTQIMNLTDVDDKTIRGAREAGLSLAEFTAKYEEAFFRDIAPAERRSRRKSYPQATDHIPEMIAMIETLRERGHTYESEGSVYFRIATFPGYGKLSRIDLTQTRRGERVADDEYEKEDVKDFALWKASEARRAVLAVALRGRPSRLAHRVLRDEHEVPRAPLRHPHRRRWTTSSRTTRTRSRRARRRRASPSSSIWLHAEHLVVDGEKMSKSKGNFYTLDDVLARRDDPAAVRYLFLSVPYRRKLNFTWEALAGAAAGVARIRSAVGRIEEVAASGAQKPGAFDAEERGRKFLAGLHAPRWTTT